MEPRAGVATNSRAKTARLAFVVPAYNEEALIGRCLESILRETEDRTDDVDIVVVDNASTDRTGAIARSYPRVRVIEEPDKGLVKARHAGYRATDAPLIANVDSDCSLTPGWVDTVFDAFDADDDLAALSGPFIYDDLGRFGRGLTRVWYAIGYAIYRIDTRVFGLGGMLQGGNFVVRRSAMEQIGGFDTSIEFYGEDSDVAYRISKVGRVKWTFKLPAYSSARRLKGEGFIATGFRYTVNHFAIHFGRGPVTKTHRDLRPHAPPGEPDSLETSGDRPRSNQVSADYGSK
ncbi:glycosyltransferase [Bauldia sp.]|uniref:glycosyltransferase n=1 Tax=Bauldia sp. TaxID=2575872 RepID=UPI003BAC8246